VTATQVEVVTFGCRLNSYESEVVRGLAHAGDRPLVVVNTCAVTAEAERQARQTIRRLRRERPETRIVVTGCAAQIDPERFAAMPEVDRVVGNDAKFAPASYAEDDGPRVRVADIMAVRETAPHLVAGFGDRTRAFLEVQQGCDHRCTFCVIPFGRGASRSVPTGDIVARARALVAGGWREIVLTGVDLTSWGADLPGSPRLGQLVRRLLALVPDLPRLRLSSIDPAEIDDDLWRALAEEPRLMPHLHLSVQHGADLILKRMKRRHLRADVLATVARARAARPGIAFGADLIAGFPTESETHFADMVDLVERAGFAFLHVFPYSPRAGTPAARMPQLPTPVIRTRAKRLRAIGEARLIAHLDGGIGRETEVLLEDGGTGRTPCWTPVVGVGGAPGGLVRVRPTRRVGLTLDASA
jgi:threonylcarbamoyladenosine tRNA methylthiotransferase MtaB